MNLTIFLNKIRNRIEIKRTFKSAAFVLQNGKYFVQGNCFSYINEASRHKGFIIKIKSNKKHNYLMKDGFFNITPYKYLFMDSKTVFSFIRGEERYYLIKKNVGELLPKLPYKTMEAFFIDDKKLLVSNVIKGVQYDDEDHLWRFINHYLNSINPDFVENKKMKMSNAVNDVLFYPQHGDCHSKNVFWDDKENPTLIDLDDVNSYPVFYDIFYYVIASKHEEAFLFFKSIKFGESLKKFGDKNSLFVNKDVVDFYVGAYAYFWINQMKKNMTFHEIGFYLQWFEKADLSSYPITSKALAQYKENLKKLGIKHGTN